MTETRPAATVLLLRDGGAGLEVFMGRRHPLTGFAGDALVFPGGRIDDADRAFARRGVCARVAGEDETATAFRVGALRETFEESGVLLARTNGRPAGAACAPARGGRAFAEFLEGEGLVLATDLLVPFAHWITPEGLFPNRFDTMFFLAAAPAGQVAAHDGEELVDSCWIAPARA
ncbi:MAG: NUDIX domain-containing protein, partial [Rhodospirillaceae bacterium]|nr:NUDIX domain-containing protein [Rhodospirillaceae bacterium]